MEKMQRLFVELQVHQPQTLHGYSMVSLKFSDSFGMISLKIISIFSLSISDSMPVELSGRVQILETGDLLISNVRESDAGLYSCVRSNEAGSVTGEAYLGVMGELFANNIRNSNRGQHKISIKLIIIRYSSHANNSAAS